MSTNYRIELDGTEESDISLEEEARRQSAAGVLTGAVVRTPGKSGQMTTDPRHGPDRRRDCERQL